jgi:hypothetical protein
VFQNNELKKEIKALRNKINDRKSESVDENKSLIIHVENSDTNKELLKKESDNEELKQKNLNLTKELENLNLKNEQLIALHSNKEKELQDTKIFIISTLSNKFISKCTQMFNDEKMSHILGFSKFFEVTYLDSLKKYNPNIDEITYVSHLLKKDSFSLEFLMPDISFNAINGNTNNMFKLKEVVKTLLDKYIYLPKEKPYFNTFKVDVCLYLKKELTVDLDNLSLVSLLINKYVVDYFKGILYFDDKTLFEIHFKTINNGEKKHKLSIKIS